MARGCCGKIAANHQHNVPEVQLAMAHTKSAGPFGCLAVKLCASSLRACAACRTLMIRQALGRFGSACVSSNALFRALFWHPDAAGWVT